MDQNQAISGGQGRFNRRGKGGKALGGGGNLEKKRKRREGEKRELPKAETISEDGKSGILFGDLTRRDPMQVREGDELSLQ